LPINVNVAMSDEASKDEPNPKDSGNAAKAESVDNMAALQSLAIWEKINRCDIHDVTKKDVQDLMKALDFEGKGSITANDVMMIKYVDDLILTESDIRSIAKAADTSGGTIYLDDLFKAMTTGSIAFGLIKEGLGKRQKEVKVYECDRSDLIDWMKNEYETTTALWSLPITILTFVSFVAVASTHVDVANSWDMESALTEVYPNLAWRMHPGTKVKDVETLTKWIQTGWQSTYFNQDLKVQDPIPGRVGVYNQIIGGVRIQKEFRQETDCQTSDALKNLYDYQGGGLCYHSGEAQVESIIIPYHLTKSVVAEKLQNMSKPLWLDKRTASVEIQTIFLNGHINMLCLQRMQWKMQPDGFLRQRMFHESWLASPYQHWRFYIPDGLFALFLIRMLYNAIVELLPALSQGLDGLVEYFTFWTLVEWMNIFGGVVCMVLWFFVVGSITGPLYNAMGDVNKIELDALVLSKGSYLTYDQISQIIPSQQLESKIDNLLNVSHGIHDQHMILRAMFFAYLFILMAKFFKAFRANARLDVVIQTLKGCALNVAHFFIVFACLFCCYSFAGYFLLGQKSEGYSTLQKSLLTSWNSLGTGMGEMEELDYTYQVMAYAWTLTFQFLVKMLVLNMLMGIVFEAYGTAKAAAGQPQTIWAQVRDAMSTARETRSFLSLWGLICAMEDDQYPAHPAKTVTARSLKRAFEKEKMTSKNAEYLLRKTSEYVLKKAGTINLSLTDAIKVVSQVKDSTLKNLSTAQRCIELFQRQVSSQEEGQQVATTQGTNQPAFAKIDAQVKATNGAAKSLKPKEIARHGVKKHIVSPLEDAATSVENIFKALEETQRQQAQFESELDEHFAEDWRLDDEQLSWLEGELSKVESNLHEIERCVGNLGNAFSGTNFSKLATVPMRMEAMMPSLESQEGQEVGLARLTEHIESIVEKVAEINSLTDDGTEMRKMLWKVELGLRKLRGGQITIPSSFFAK
jgi:hypothetical protein